jgi:hypothetical protein
MLPVLRAGAQPLGKRPKLDRDNPATASIQANSEAWKDIVDDCD